MAFPDDATQPLESRGPRESALIQEDESSGHGGVRASRVAGEGAEEKFVKLIEEGKES